MKKNEVKESIVTQYCKQQGWVSRNTISDLKLCNDETCESCRQWETHLETALESCSFEILDFGKDYVESMKEYKNPFPNPPIKSYQNGIEIAECELLNSLTLVKKDGWSKEYKDNNNKEFILIFNDMMGYSSSYADLYEK